MSRERSRTQVGTDLVGRVTLLEREVSDINANVSSILTQQRTILDALAGIEDRLNRPPPATNWVGIGTLVLSTAAVIGALGVFALDPVRERTIETSDRLTLLSGALGDQRVGLAAVKEKLEWHQNWINSLQDAGTKDREKISVLAVNEARGECKP